MEVDPILQEVLAPPQSTMSTGAANSEAPRSSAGQEAQTASTSESSFEVLSGASQQAAGVVSDYVPKLGGEAVPKGILD